MVSGPTVPYDSTVRTVFDDESIRVYSWPSRGGVIILENPEAIDFEFLGLNRLNPPANRHDDQDAEDEFCQRLLLLGAKCWDSEERYFTVNRIKLIAHGYAAVNAHGDGSFGNVTNPYATLREKRWVKVGWPGTGGFWVSEFDTTWAGVDDEENLPPNEGLARVRMARTMDERCQILKDWFKGKFYKSVKDYEGYAFLRAWEWKSTGEVGRPLLTPDETVEQWAESRSFRWEKGSTTARNLISQLCAKTNAATLPQACVSDSGSVPLGYLSAKHAGPHQRLTSGIDGQHQASTTNMGHRWPVVKSILTFGV